MTRILRFLRGNSFLLVAVAVAFLAFAPACRAADPSPKQEKHARKIEKKLSKLRTGALVQIDLRDSSQALGTLGDRSDATFQIVNADSNKVQTFNYIDVNRVRKAREYIGSGSEGHHFRHWIPLAIVAAVAAGGGIAAYEATR